MAQKGKILVTGGAGYIGAHTCVELIQSGYETVIVDNLSRSDRTLMDGVKKITGVAPKFFEGDCGDENFLRETFHACGPISAVMHFAAFKSVGESVAKPLDYYHNNVESLVVLLKIMQEFRVNVIIFSSSCTVYGEPDRIPVTEDAPLKPAESPYGATKQMCERILMDVRLTGVKAISLRYFNPIGAHPSALIGELPIGVPSNLVPYITQTAAGKRDKLTVFGTDYNTPDGTCIRDFIHIVDLARAHVQAMEYIAMVPGNQSYKVFNLGSGEGVSVMQLIKTFERVSGKSLNYILGPRRPGDVEKTYADPTSANRELGWKTKFTMEDALTHAWNWERQLLQRTNGQG